MGITTLIATALNYCNTISCCLILCSLHNKAAAASGDLASCSSMAPVPYPTTGEGASSTLSSGDHPPSLSSVAARNSSYFGPGSSARASFGPGSGIAFSQQEEASSGRDSATDPRSGPHVVLGGPTASGGDSLPPASGLTMFTDSILMSTDGCGEPASGGVHQPQNVNSSGALTSNAGAGMTEAMVSYVGQARVRSRFNKDKEGRGASGGARGGRGRGDRGNDPGMSLMADPRCDMCDMCDT